MTILEHSVSAHFGSHTHIDVVDVRFINSHLLHIYTQTYI